MTEYTRGALQPSRKPTTQAFQPQPLRQVSWRAQLVHPTQARSPQSQRQQPQPQPQPQQQPHQKSPSIPAEPTLKDLDQFAKSLNPIWPLYTNNPLCIALFRAELTERHSFLPALWACSEYFQTIEDKNIQRSKYDAQTFMISFYKLKTQSPLGENFAKELHEEPQCVLTCLTMALHHALLMKSDKHYAQLASPTANSTSTSSTTATAKDQFPLSSGWVSLITPPLIPNKSIIVRITEVSPEIPLSSIRAIHVDKFVCVQGTIVRVAPLHPLVQAVQVECANCSAVSTQTFPDGRYCQPESICACPVQFSFTKIVRSKALAIDWQCVRLQEKMEDGLIIGAPNVDLESHDSTPSKGIKSGRMPRLLDCELSGELVEQLNPGDIVIMSGIIRSRKVDQTARGRNTAELTLFLDVNQVSTTHSTKQPKLIKQPHSSMDEFSSSDLSRIASLIASQRRYSLFHHFVQSLCPAIMGHEFVKAGLVLCLMGGSSSSSKEWRSNIHILVVGDPGLGKSQLLRAVSRVSPRGVFVCGNLATKSGLTVTLSRDPNSSEHSLEAGALLLANDGACCIDELDKMSAEHAALLEAMEQQRISVAKAGIVATLPARTSVFAAANPIGGHYNRGKSVAENLKISGALLSRFDLLFILLDKNDFARDALLSEHIIELHNKHSRKRGRVDVDPNDAPVPNNFDGEKKVELIDLLQGACADTQLQPIPINELRLCISYARKFVHPKLSQGAKDALQTYYLSLRSKHSGDGAPITTRQLEALIRLAQARARCEFRGVVTKADAADVICLMQASLSDIHTVDDSGNMDFRRGGAAGASKSKSRNALVRLLQARNRTGMDNISRAEIMELAKSIKIDDPLQVDLLIQQLNDHGLILIAPGGKYQISSNLR